MWHEGVICVPYNDEQYTLVHYWLKAYEEPSQYGIEGGKVSKLTLTVDGEVTYNYDRGLDIPPKTEAVGKALAILLHEYN